MTRHALPLCLAAALALPATPGIARHHADTAVPGRLFISPMGEPFRSGRDGDPEAAWFAGADTDHDGRISLAEFQADAGRWFDVADRRHAGEIDPDDIDWYENHLVPEIRVADAPREARRPVADSAPAGRHGRGMGGGPGGGMGGRMGGGEGRGDAGSATPREAAARVQRQGAGRYGYLDIPEPLTAADANLNRGIDRGEMIRAAAERFARLDRNGDGFLERRELPRVDTRVASVLPASRAATAAPPPVDRNRQLGGGDRDQD